MTTKNSQLLDLLQSAHDSEQVYLGGVTQSERLKVGQPNLWSPKDVLSHIAEWKSIMAQRLHAYRHDQDAPVYSSLDAKNAEIFENIHGLSWDEVTSSLRRSYAGLHSEVQLLSDEVLLAPARFEWQRGDPLLTRIPFNAYVHPLFHIAQLYVDRDDRPAGDRLIETMTSGMFTLDETPQWKGRWTYTRACYYAIAGDKPKAFADLREAFAIRPELIAWSQEDTDLQSLRNDSEFQALISK
jgi:hypothetical protein